MRRRKIAAGLALIVGVVIAVWSWPPDWVPTRSSAPPAPAPSRSATGALLFDCEPFERCSASTQILDAADAVDRWRETRRPSEQVEAMRLFQLATRDASNDPQFGLLVNYYYAADVAVKSGDKDGDLRAKVCSAELHGERFGSYGPGDCKKLSDAYYEKMKREAGAK